MHIIEPRQIGVLVGQPRVPKVVPHRPAGPAVQLIQLARRERMQGLDEFTDVRRVRISARDDMIMIREYGPRFKIPAVNLRLVKKDALEQIALRGGFE